MQVRTVPGTIRSVSVGIARKNSEPWILSNRQAAAGEHDSGDERTF